MLKDAFLFAEARVLDSGFSDEIAWQNSVSFERLEENTFLQEYAWVVLASGMREAVVRRKFPLVSECFHFWSSAADIAFTSERCVQDAMRVFRHEPKIRAIASTAALLARVGFLNFKRTLNREPIPTLRTLPYIGPTTQYHLAKNIGLDVAKPDRHLIRIANLFGFLSVRDFCDAVAHDVRKKVAVVDLVFWRFATLDKNYLGTLQEFVTQGKKTPTRPPSNQSSPKIRSH